jgi:membrane protease YdiL (CAAX protease family)
VSISATIVQDLSFIGAALLFASISSRPLPEQFGLRPTRFWPAVGWIAVAFAAFYVVTLVWVAILGVSPDDTKLPDELGVKDSTYALLAVAFLVAVVAPMAEEFFFRGFLFGALRGYLKLWPAALITGLVFGLIHFKPEFLAPLAVLGVALCLLYAQTGSLLPCIALHSLNNSLAFGVTQGWTWQIPLLMVVSLAILTLILTPIVRRAALPVP